MVFKRRFLFMMAMALLFSVPFAVANVARAATAVFINEIHYDNDGTDTGEAIEVAGPAGTDLTGWSLVLYNGNGGGEYDTDALSGTIPDDGAGFGFVVVNYPSNGIQNGSPDGVALVDGGGNVVQFLSYEGSFTATDGPAAGMTSTDIGVAESSSTAAGDSLQLTGTGAIDEDFAWSAEQPSTFGAANTGQTFTGGPVEPAAPLINEFVFNHTSTDDFAFIEILGDADTDYSAYTLLEIEGDSTSAGVVDAVINLGTTDANGYWLDGEDAENGTVSLLLVKDFSGALSDDLDSDNDGVLDASPWSELVDAVAVTDGGGSDFTYGGVELAAGFDGGSFTVGGASRIPNGTDTDAPSDWVRNDFDLAGIEAGSPDPGEALNTPGAMNELVPLAAPVLVINEVDYDQPSTDTAEFLEIKNIGAAAADLDGVSVQLVNGSNASVYDTINLPAVTLAAGDYFVVCANAATVANCDLDDGPDTNFIQNGSPDAVALVYDGAIMDAVSYEGDTTGYTEGSGSGLTDDSGADDVSISRCDDGVDTDQNNVDFTQTAATPGAANSCGGGEPTVGALLLTEIVVTPTAGEFVEIYNPGSETVDLTDYYLTDGTFAGGGTYYYNIVTGTNAGGGGFGDFHARFPAGATIAAGEYQTVAMTGSADFLVEYGVAPTYELFDDGSADGEQQMVEAADGSINGQGGLTNSGEVVVLYYWDGQSDLVTDMDYVVWGDKAEAVDKTGVAIDGPDADSDTSTYLADTAISSQDALGAGHAGDKSWQREDLTEGTEATSGGNGVGGADETSENLSVTWCEDDPTPNAATVCDGGGAGQEAKIHEVQGSGPNIAISGTVIVEAIVVGDYQGDDELRGFFIQEEDADADADPNTSEGIFVYCGFCDDAVAVGDLVQVTGLAEDFFDMSQIDVTESGSSVVVVSSGNALPTPATVDLPASGSTEAAATFESVEGMLVSFTDTLYVSEYFELARYGQLVLTADARPRQFTDEFEPGVAEYAAFLTDLESKRIILDDNNNTQNAPLASNPADDTPYYWPTPGLSDTNYVRGGDSISGLTGVMHWSFAGQSGTDAWRIRPVTEAFTYDFTEENPRTEMPDAVGGSFTVASFNVLNYFTTIDSRGADSLVELDRQREKIAAAICAMDADVVGLIEIENNGSVALNDLLNGANGINANCGPYAYVDTGVIGTDEIAVAFIYKTATAVPVGDFAVLDSSVDSRFVDTKNRPALAQTFEETATGGMLTVVVNHLKSKGSDCNDLGDPDLGDGQANCNLTRANAAAAMVDWLATDPTGSGDPDFLIIGDLNAYRNEDPIDNLELGGYTDLLDAFLGGAAYSYVFDGQVGYLDYALANGDLLGQVTGVTAWHINADEIPVFDYNDGVQDGGEPSFQRESTALDIYEPDAYRASDHDPVLVGLNMFVPNTPPVVEAITLPEPASVGDPVTVSALFSDVDGTSDEPFTCTVDFGDGMGPQVGTVNGFTCEASTTYTESGFYAVTVTVADVHGDSDTASAEYVVIFDSSLRGAVGRGKFAVSEGDYRLDPSITGRTVFFFKAQYRGEGLVGLLNMSVYEKGTRIFEMRSTGLDWLVLDGSVAIFEGSGQIDGSGDYGFRATAVTSRDGSGNFSEDLIRIVIWDKTTGEIVFDNQSTCSDQSMLAIPCSTIKGGAIRTYIVD